MTLLFCADDFDRKDEADRTVLVACRSDPPPRTDFDEMVFLSRTHAELMGHPTRPFVGGGVDLADYRAPLPRVPRRVICTSSPDRCAQASAIGAAFDFVHTYRPVGGVGHEYTRDELVRIQQTAMVQIYPLDPRRPSDMYSMSVLEAMAAGTPGDHQRRRRDARVLGRRRARAAAAHRPGRVGGGDGASSH
jgi:hypothetical protein